MSKWYLAQGGLLPQAGMLGLVGVAVLMVSALLTAGYLMSIVVNGFFPGKDFDYAILAEEGAELFDDGTSGAAEYCCSRLA